MYQYRRTYVPPDFPKQSDYSRYIPGTEVLIISFGTLRLVPHLRFVREGIPYQVQHCSKNTVSLTAANVSKRTNLTCCSERRR